MQNNRGFNLIELMLAILIIGILIFFSVSIFSSHFLREKRLAAELSLIKTADALEQFYLTHHSYQSATLDALGISDMIADKHYKLVIKASSEDDFTLAAIPEKTNDTECATLLLHSSGKKDITGTGHANKCWQ